MVQRVQPSAVLGGQVCGCSCSHLGHVQAHSYTPLASCLLRFTAGEASIQRTAQQLAEENRGEIAVIEGELRVGTSLAVLFV